VRAGAVVMERLWCGAGKSKDKRGTDLSDCDVAAWTVDDRQPPANASHQTYQTGRLYASVLAMLLYTQYYTDYTSVRRQCKL